MINNLNVNRLNMFLSWTSIFLWCWAILIGSIDLNVSSVLIFVFFVLVAIFAGISDINNSKEEIEKLRRLLPGLEDEENSTKGEKPQ